MRGKILLWVGITLGALLGVVSSPLHAQNGRPVIELFRAVTPVIDKVQGVRLDWKVQGASRVDIYDGYFNRTYESLTLPTGFIEVWPERTADFVLYAYAADGSSVSSRLTITFNRIDPVIDSFTASQTSIDSVQPIRLSWQVAHAKRVDIQDGFRNTTYANLVMPAGYIDVYPERTATYTLQVYGQQNQVITRQITISFINREPTVEYFYATPEVVNARQNVRITWNVRNADRIDLYLNDGYTTTPYPDLGPQSALDVALERTTTATLYYYSRAGQQYSRQVIIQVNPLAPVIHGFNLSSLAVRRGEAVNACWNAANTNRVMLVYDRGRHGGVVDYLPASGCRIFYPEKTTQVLLYAYSQDGRYVTSQPYYLEVRE
jgi:hypothetical protein